MDIHNPSHEAQQPDLVSLFTIDDVAHRTKLGRTTLFAILKSGELRSVKVGRSRRIPASALIEFIDRLERGA